MASTSPHEGATQQADVLALVFSRLAADDALALQRAAQVCVSWLQAARCTVGFCAAKLQRTEAEGLACVEALTYIEARSAPVAVAASNVLRDQRLLPRAVRTGQGWADTIAAGCTDGAAHLWEVHTQRNAGELPLPPSPWMGGAVYALAHLPEQGWLAGGSYDNSIKLWDLSVSASSLCCLARSAAHAPLLACAPLCLCHSRDSRLECCAATRAG